MNKLTELKRIIADAPEGATHCKDKPSKSDTVFYYKMGDFCWHFWARSQWFKYHECTAFTRSLADIRTIIEQAEEIKRLAQQNSSLNICLSDQMERISELRKQTAYLDTCLDIAERHLHDEHFEYYTEEVELLGKKQMKSSTNTLIDAMKILASDVESGDGVANYAIFEASERLEEQAERIAELEDSFDDLERENKLLEDLLRNESRRSEAHNLEQQAKGLENYANEELSGLDADNIHWMLIRAKNLREKAKKLKGGAE